MFILMHSLIYKVKVRVKNWETPKEPVSSSAYTCLNNTNIHQITEKCVWGHECSRSSFAKIFQIKKGNNSRTVNDSQPKSNSVYVLSFWALWKSFIEFEWLWGTLNLKCANENRTDGQKDGRTFKGYTSCPRCEQKYK